MNPEERNAAGSRAAAVRPGPRQRAWQEGEISTFIHFGMSTFRDTSDWGTGDEDPAQFAPTGFDPDQWVEVARAIGSQMLIFTAKHHDGFCLWPTESTDHHIGHSPWRDGEGDMVAEVAAACRRAGLAFGIYLSPWDRHEPTYGTPAYNDVFKQQLRELCTHYGELAEIWFDGACGESRFGRQQPYDWPGFVSLIRELQPNALIANQGPDIRWVGNEAAVARGDEWSVFGLDVPPEQFRNWKAVAEEALFSPHTDGMTRNGVRSLADRATLANRAHLFWYPAEAPHSLRLSWFWHPGRDNLVRSVEQLTEAYYKSVGRNTVLLLGLSPDRNGRIPDLDVQRVRDWREVIEETFRHDRATGARAEASSGAESAACALAGSAETGWQPDSADEEPVLEITPEEPVRFNRVMLQEQIDFGEQVEQWVFEVDLGDGWQTFAAGGAIGHKRLFPIGDITARAVRLRLRALRGRPVLRRIGLFHARPGG